MLALLLSSLLFLHPLASQTKSPFLPDSFQAEYEQTIKKKISGKLKKARGQIKYLYPGNILFKQTEPEKLVWVSNPKTTWFYQAPFIKGEPGNLRITPTEVNSPSKIFDFLKRGLNDNGSYTVKKNGKTIELIFNPQKIKSKFQKAVLTFNGTPVFKNLRSIKMVEKNGDPLTLTFKSLSIGKSFKPKHFVFKPPPNTRIEE